MCSFIAVLEFSILEIKKIMVFNFEYHKARIIGISEKCIRAGNRNFQLGGRICLRIDCGNDVLHTHVADVNGWIAAVEGLIRDLPPAYEA